MSDKKDFFIGYLPKAPKRIARTSLLAVLLFFVLLGVSAFMVVNYQRTINNGTYEYGELTEVEGLIYYKPQPFIKVFQGKDINGDPVFKNILLIDFGKFGATETLRKIEAKSTRQFNSVYIKLRGTLVYHDGTTLLELTEKENSYISYRPLIDRYLYSKAKSDLGTQTLKGEIVDPKCFFGSMKPGEGIPHKSCAALCLSGGIPAMYVTQNEQGHNEYLLVLGEDGQPVNKEIMKYVADPVSISGRVERWDEWKTIYINPEEIKRLQ